jgi:hypothetical protein
VPLQLADLRFADAGDERRMIVGSPPLVTVATPTTYLAMFNRLRIGGTGDRSRDGTLKTAPDMPIVRAIVGDPVRLGDEVRTGRNHEGGSWLSLLGLRQQVRVE